MNPIKEGTQLGLAKPPTTGTPSMAQADLDYVQLYLAIEQATSISDCIKLAFHMKNEPRDSAILPDFMEKLVHRMYCCRDMTFFNLRDLFLEPSDVMDMSRFNAEDMIKNWEENNGLLKKTLPMVSSGMSLFIYKLSVSYDEAIQSIIDMHMGGVMDLMFLVSSQNFRISSEMGMSFWPFAKALTQITVRTSDRLNFLLYKGVIPQTIICLKPIVYSVDGVESTLAPNLFLRGVTLGDGTRTRILTQRELVVHQGGSISVEDVVFEHRNPCMESFNLIVGGCYYNKTQNANFRSVTFVGGGLNITNVATVEVTDCCFDRCCIGMYLTHVDTFIARGNDSYEDAKFEHCDTALFLCHVDWVDIRQISFRRCRQVMDAFVSLNFCMADSEVMFCRSMGTLLMLERKMADFGNNTVNVRTSLAFSKGQ